MPETVYHRPKAGRIVARLDSFSRRLAPLTGRLGRHVAQVVFAAVALVPPLGAAITVATFNVENYVTADRMVDGVYRPGYPKPESERIALRRVIVGIAPDILAVEEMGPTPFLAQFQRELKQAGQDFPFTVLLEAADPDRHVAVLSKLPLREVRRHAAVSTSSRRSAGQMKRGVLEVVVATTAGDLSIFVLHLKSRHTEDADDPESAAQRAAEAEAARDLVRERFPDPAKGKFIVCGDWNDTRASRPVRALQRRGDTALGEILDAADSHGETWTHFYRKQDTYSRIDYFLVSAELQPLVADGRARIWDGPGTAEASDHRAVFLKLAVEPMRPAVGGR